MSEITDPVATGDNTPNPEAAAEGGAGETPEQPSSKPDNALAARLRKAEKELAASQKRLEEYEASKLSELERAQKDAEKWQQQAQAAQDRWQSVAKTTALKIALKDASVVNVDAAIKLADISALELDDSGEVSGVDTVIKSLQADYDFLFGRPPSPSSGGGNPPSGPPRYTPAEIARLKGDDWEAFEAKVLSGEIKL